MKFRILLLLFLAIRLLSFGQATDYKAPDVEVYKLANGLTVILNEDHNSPQVFGGVVVKAGSKDDPKGATGMAHYQEHMLFKGTEELGTTDWAAEKVINDQIFALYDKLGKTTDPEERKKIQTEINEQSLKASQYVIPNELSKLIKSMGGTQLNAGTGPDVTIYYNAFPPNQMERWLHLYGHRFEKPVFRLFQAELETVYEEKNMYNDQFVFPLIENFNKNFFKNHPYGQQTTIGTVEDLKNPSLTKMYEFFTTWYVPNNMALVLVGDFDKSTVKPLIEAKFGQWKAKELPARPVYDEKSFNGREFVEMKLSPVKLALLGYRTVPAGHPDEIPLGICNAILSNASQTGLFDKLMLDNKVMAAQVLSMPYNDQGEAVFLIVPKLIGQKLPTAEKLVLDEVSKLKKGEFDTTLMTTIRMELYRDYMLNMESNQYKANMLASAYGRHQAIEDLLQYPQRLKMVSREDVIRVANKYYGENYLAFYSNMGFPKKEKIEKPGFVPVTANTNAVSPYAKAFEAIPETPMQPRFIDFSKDVEHIAMSDALQVYGVKNPANDIFSLTLRFKVGDKRLPLLKYATMAMDYAYPEGSSLNAYKTRFAAIGCTCSFSCDESYTSINLTGFDSHLKEALELVNLILTKPVLEQDKIKIIYEGEKAGRKIERSEPDNVAEALYSWVRYAEKSEFLERKTLKEIKAMQSSQLLDVFKSILNYPLEVHYAGRIDTKVVAETCKSTIPLEAKEKSDSPVVPELRQYGENTVYFVHKKKATQSKVYLFGNGSAYDPANQADMDAFNMYFGGDFSGLVLQEIREYRSLAYTAGARFGVPALHGKETYFTAYVGTQADKTLDALGVFDTLIHHMPMKEERTAMIRQYLLQSSVTERPGFRNLSMQVLRWQNQGFTYDPAKYKREAYEKLSFDNIRNFYQAMLATKPMAIGIVGDKKKIDLDKLSNYGKLIYVKESSLFRD